MSAVALVLLALVASPLLAAAAPTSAPIPTVPYFRVAESPSWRLHASTAASASPAVSAVSSSRALGSWPVSFLWQFPLRNLDWLRSEVEETSNPASPRFLQRQSEAETDAMIGPSSADKDEVRVWLRGNGVDDSHITVQRHTLKVDTSAAVVERLFNTTLHRYRHAGSGRTAVVARSSVYVPAALAVRLSGLSGVYNFPDNVYHVHAIRAKPRPIAVSKVSGDIGSVNKRSGQAQRRAGNASHAMQVMQMQETNVQCDDSVTIFLATIAPSSIAAAYNFDLRDTNTTAVSTSAAVAGGFFSYNSDAQNYNEAFSPTDLTWFGSNIGFSQAFTAQSYGNDNNAQNLAYNVDSTGVGPTDEASLDIQALFQISPTSTNGFYAVTGQQDGLYESLNGILNLSPSIRPQVVSYSYAFGDSDYEYRVNSNGAATEIALAALAYAGVTVVASAGDDGAPSPNNRQCKTAGSLNNQYLAPSSYSGTVMIPLYPASSTYVLSVAETQFLGGAQSPKGDYFDQSVNSPPECNNCPTDRDYGFLCQTSPLLPETAVSVTNTVAYDETTTGGGFSFVFPQPSWQQAAVSNYLQSACSGSGCTLPPSSQFNANNRAYPDVAAFGGYLPIVVNGKEEVQSGTSVATPIWAGFIARLNEVIIARYGTSIGLAAPLLYNLSAVQRSGGSSFFHDITTGNNICPRSNPACVTAVNSGNLAGTSCQGFQAAAGWDPVTGLGSPNIGNMLAYLAASSGEAVGSTAAAADALESSSSGLSVGSTAAASGAGMSSGARSSGGGGGGVTPTSTGRNGAAGMLDDVGVWSIVVCAAWVALTLLSRWDQPNIEV